MTPEEYEADYRKRCTQRIKDLIGDPPSGEEWAELSIQERAKRNASTRAAAWLEDYKYTMEALAQMTGLSIEAAIAFYFGMETKQVTRFIAGLSPYEPPKEPWQQ